MRRCNCIGMIDQDLKKNIFWDPLKNGANELLIVSGYATPNMASWLMKNLKKSDTFIRLRQNVPL